MLVERDGRLAASSEDGVASDTNGNPVRLLATESKVQQFQETAKQILKRHGSFSASVPESFSFGSSNGTLFVSVSSVQHPLGIDWVTVVMIPRSDWYGPIDRAHWIAGIVGATFLFLAIIVAIGYAYIIARPLRSIANVMRRITKNLELVHDKNASSSRLKEIADLEESFARLLHTLSSFMKYVPVEVVRLLLEHNAEAVRGVEPRTVTLFFSDIAGFTSISEQISPQQLISILSDYFAVASDTILQSDGTLVDYIGDAVFAFWNAPKDVPDHASAACEAALQQQESLKALNSEWAKQGLPGFSIRIGIHTGPALCGNIGCFKRMKYTAIGDAVNLASRLENLNKRYSTNILISSDVYEQVQQDYLCRVLDVVQVKGRQTPSWIFELVARKREATQKQVQLCELSHAELTCYLNRDFQGCLIHLKKLEELEPGHKTVSLRQQRCQQYIQSPPPADWTGVEVLLEK
jgi:adenylate cyclase